MGEESTLSERELLEQDAARHEREAARRLELAAAKRRHAAELARIEAEFGDPAAVQHTRTAPLKARSPRRSAPKLAVPIPSPWMPLSGSM